MDAKQLPGPIKAAILIQTLEDAAAQSLLGLLGKEERRIIEDSMAKMGEIEPAVREKVAREFLSLLGLNDRVTGSGRRTAIGYDDVEAGDAYEEKPPAPPSMKSLESEEPDDLVRLIRDEHPQTIAIILAHMSAPKAGEVLALLPDDIKTDVAIRIASSDRFAAEMVEEVHTVFDLVLKKKQRSGPAKSGGVDSVAEILNNMDKEVGQTIIEEIEERDAVMAAEIKQRMFIFDDVVLVDDRGFQQVLRRVDQQDLAVALKAASEDIRQKVFRNMSERAGAMLREEMDSLGPVKMTEVERAQQAILVIIQQMESEGSLVIQRGGGDEFVE